MMMMNKAIMIIIIMRQTIGWRLAAASVARRCSSLAAFFSS